MRVLLKDKKDLNALRTREDIWSNEDYEIVGSQDEINRDLQVEVLSVKFSKVGQKTFNAYPNLKWIICRSHGYDNIRADLAEKYNVGIVCTNPNTIEVAEWIKHKVIGDKTLVLGGGRIGKKFCEIYNGETFVVTSKTEYDYDIVKNYDTIVVASSPTENPILTKELLENFRGGIVSISRPSCIDNKALLDAINDGKILYAEMDMLDTTLRQELIDTNKCRYYKHTAWGNDKTAYSDYYFENLFREIDLCLESKSENVVLKRTRNVLFGD